MKSSSVKSSKVAESVKALAGAVGLLGLGVLGISSCSGSDRACAFGLQGCRCGPGGQCDPGLSCDSRDLCIANGVGGAGATGGFGTTDAGGAGAVVGTGGVTAGGSGGAAANVDLHCEGSPPEEDLCTCINDVNDVWTPAEGIGECSRTSVGGGLCCGDLGYPADGTCQCTRWGCFESDSTCTCGSGYSDLPDCVRAWPFCCATITNGRTTLCSCSNIDPGCNGPDQVSVATCGLASTACYADELKLDRCGPL